MHILSFFFFSSSCFLVSLLKCKFCAYVEEFDAAPQSHLSDIYYSGPLFFGEGGVFEVSGNPAPDLNAKLRLLSPEPCRTKASAYLKRRFQGGGGAI